MLVSTVAVLAAMAGMHACHSVSDSDESIAAQTFQENTLELIGANGTDGAGASSEACDKVDEPANAARSTEEWLQKADDDLKKVYTDLRKTDSELNVGKTMRNIDEAWLSIIRAMQGAMEEGNMTDEIMNLASRAVKRIDRLTEKIIDRALKKAGDALVEGRGDGLDATTQMQCAIAALENAEVVTNAAVIKCGNGVYWNEEWSADWYANKFAEGAFELMRIAFETIAKIMDENAREQDDTMSSFSDAMRVFMEGVERFKPHQAYNLSQIEALRRSAKKAEQEAAKVGLDATIMSISLARIINAVQKISCWMAQFYGAEIPAGCDENIRKTVTGFDNVMRAFRLKFRIRYREVENLKSFILITTYSMKNVNVIRNLLKVKMARQCNNQIKKEIGEMKAEYNALNEGFNKMIGMSMEGGRARTVNEEDKLPKEPVSDNTEQDIHCNAYILQRSIARRRRAIADMIIKVYSAEKSVADQENCFSTLIQTYERNQ